MATKETKQAKTEAETPELSPFEIGDETTTVRFRGEEFVFPASRAKWPTPAMQAFQGGRYFDGVELLFGPTQWRSLNRVGPLAEDFWEFFVIFGEASGVAKRNDSAAKDA